MTARTKRSIILLADGARSDVFEMLLAKGDLPHLARECVEKGGYKAITTSFPSTTGPAYLPYLSGCYPGTCNIPGIRWFDKARYAAGPLARSRYRSYVGIKTHRINADMRPDIATLFELLPHSYNILNAVYRGVKPRCNLTAWSRIWLLYYGHLTDHWNWIDTRAHELLLTAVQDDFEFIFVVFPGIDEYSHRSHPHEDAVLEQYRFIDKAVGDIKERLERDGRWEETLFLLVSDHGLSETGSHFELFDFLEARGIRTFYYPLIYRRGCEAASMISGNGMSNLYFDIGGKGGKRLPYEALMERYGSTLRDLAAQEAVDVLACEDMKGRVRFFCKGEEGIIEDVGGHLHYSFAKKDPLGLFTAPTILDSLAALEMTEASEHPDILMQLSQIFRAPRTGDVVVSAKPGHDFRKRYEVPLHRASHGALSRAHMRIPCFSTHPLPPGPLRSVDLFPFLLALMGKEPPEFIDGRLAKI